MISGTERSVVRQIRAVIVNYDSGPFLADLLASLCIAIDKVRDRLAVRVVVVDNGSSDGSDGACARSSFDVELRKMSANLGFGAAVNEALAAGDEAWALVMNADILLPEDFFIEFLELVDDVAEDVGLLAPVLQNEDGSLQHSIGRYPTLLNTLFGLTRSRKTRKYLVRSSHRRGYVQWATGACLFIRRICWEDLGGFDPRFFLYYEDVDFCRRANERRMRVLYQPRLRAVHRDPLAQREKTASSQLGPVIRCSQLLYFRLHRPSAEFWLLAGPTLLWARWRGMVERRGEADERADWRWIGSFIRRARHAGVRAPIRRDPRSRPVLPNDLVLESGSPWRPWESATADNLRRLP